MFDTLDLVIQHEVCNQIHIRAGLVRAVLLNDASRNTHSNTVTRKVPHNNRPSPNFAPCPNGNRAQHADPSTQQHSMACMHYK